MTALTHLQVLLPALQQRAHRARQRVARIPLRERRLREVRVHDVLHAPRVLAVGVERRELPAHDAPVRPRPRTRLRYDARARGLELREQRGGNEVVDDDEPVALEALFRRRACHCFSSSFSSLESDGERVMGVGVREQCVYSFVVKARPVKHMLLGPPQTEVQNLNHTVAGRLSMIWSSFSLRVASYPRFYFPEYSFSIYRSLAYKNMLLRRCSKMLVARWEGSGQRVDFESSRVCRTNHSLPLIRAHTQATYLTRSP